MRHIAAYMVNIGLLTEKEGFEAFKYVGPCEPDNPDWVRLNRPLRRTSQVIGVGMEFRRMEAARFCDWLFMTGRHTKFEFSCFILRIVRDLSLSGARRLNEQGPKPTAKGLNYFHDALSAAAVSILYGGTYRRIVKLENWSHGPEIDFKYESREKKRGKKRPINRMKTATRDTIIVNGQYTVVASEVIMAFLEDEIGEFFVLNEHKHADGIWSTGKKMRQGSSMTMVAVGIARSNFVGMEVGRYSQKVNELAGEHRDSRRSRDIDTSVDIMATTAEFCENSESLTEKQREILRVEMGRPTHLEPDAFGYYVAITGDQPHQRQYYRELIRAKAALCDFFDYADEEGVFQDEENTRKLRISYGKKIRTRQFRDSAENPDRFTGLFFGKVSAAQVRPKLAILCPPYCPDGSKWVRQEADQWIFEKSGVFQPAQPCEFADCI